MSTRARKWPEQTSWGTLHLASPQFLNRAQQAQAGVLCRCLILTFAGGSTIVLLFERGALEWDDDLLANGQASLETLVRVGMGVGRKKAGFEPQPDARAKA